MNDFSSNLDWFYMTDKRLIETIGQFIQHHRVQQNRSQSAVAEDAGISRSTLSLLERGEKVALITLIRVLRVLDLLHVMDVFKVEQEISPVAYAQLQKKKRQRARSKGNDSQVNEDLGW